MINQTYTNWELIIVDDGSSDHLTLTILEDYSMYDDRIKVYYLDQHYGPTYTRNILMTHVRGDFVALMDDDDLSYPDRLERQLRYL